MRLAYGGAFLVGWCAVEDLDLRGRIVGDDDGEPHAVVEAVGAEPLDGVDEQLVSAVVALAPLERVPFEPADVAEIAGAPRATTLDVDGEMGGDQVSSPRCRGVTAE